MLTYKRWDEWEIIVSQISFDKFSYNCVVSVVPADEVVLLDAGGVMTWYGSCMSWKQVTEILIVCVIHISLGKYVVLDCVLSGNYQLMN